MGVLILRISVSRVNLLFLLLLALVPGDSLGANQAARSAPTDEKVRAVHARSTPEEHRLIVLDLRIHPLFSADSEAITTTLTTQEISRVIEGVNQVWSQAVIQW